ncbi:DUF2182 domain-containing protein [Prosthecomicrobium sp. N25]|uniref:DUF2182 domain-containing protein n=1 Tax=Prosthecomicrobium sp. N25 TaxID=3129254 RepID=UPI00307780F9
MTRRLEILAAASGLVAVGSMAWLAVLLGIGTGMSAIEMTRMAGMDGWLMTPAVWSASYGLLVFAMWWVMMAAMMLPSAWPMLLLFARVNRRSGTPADRLAATGLFGLGYLAAWGGFSLLATGLQAGLEQARLMSPMMVVDNVRLAGLVLLAAGLWQFTPFKARCLGRCRSPLAFLVDRWRDGAGGALRMGLEHGLWCLGCCWVLMALLFVGGIMNLYWIVGLAAFVLVEKNAPFGPAAGRVAGCTLVASGAWLLVR